MSKFEVLDTISSKYVEAKGIWLFDNGVMALDFGDRPHVLHGLFNVPGTDEFMMTDITINGNVVTYIPENGILGLELAAGVKLKNKFKCDNNKLAVAIYKEYSV